MYEYHGNKGSRRQQEIKEPLTLYRAGGFLFISCRRYQTDHLQIYSGGVRILNVQLEESEKRKHLVTVAGGIVCLIVLLTGTDAGRAQYRYVKPENEGQKVYMEGMKEVLDYCNGNAEKKFLLDGFSFNYYKGSALETESYGPRNAVSFGTWFSNSPSAIEKWKNYFTEDDAAIYVIVYEDGNMENYPAIRMMSEQMQCPAVLDDRIDVSTGITYLVWRIGK